MTTKRTLSVLIIALAIVCLCSLGRASDAGGTGVGGKDTTIRINTETDFKRELRDGDILAIGNDILLVDKITLDIPSDVTVKLDLNGKTLKRAGDVLTVNGYGTLIIKDSEGNTGKIENTDTKKNTGTAVINNTCAVRLNESVGLQLEGGTIIASEGGSNEAVDVNWDTNLTGLIKINGGTVAATGTGDAIAYDGNGSLIVNDGTIKADQGNAINLGFDKTGSLTVKGGLVESFEGCAIKHIGKGKIEISGGKVTSQTREDAKGTIWITKDASAKGETALEITGATVENTSDKDVGMPKAIFNESQGNVEISGGTISSKENNTILVKKHPDSSADPGELIISGGTISNTLINDNVHASVNVEESTVTISGGEISCAGGTANGGGTVYLNNATLNLYGGTVSHASAEPNRYAVYSYLNNSKINIKSGGAVLQSNNAAINQKPDTIASDVAIIASDNCEGTGKSKVELSTLPGTYKYLQFADLVNFGGLTADGSDTEYTTKLTLTFDKDVAGLTADDLTVTGAIKGELTKTAGKTGEYALAISGITQNSLTVTVATKDGVYFNPDNLSANALFEKVATPAISPASGDISDGKNVTISCQTAGASIYYTLDGMTPTKQSTLYTATFYVSEPKTVKAIAVKDNMVNSDVAEAVYTKAVQFTSLAANGSAIETTTKLTFTFNADIANLSAGDITLTGATKGTLVKQSTGVYDLSVSGITVDGSEIKASVAKDGYIITPAENTTTARVYNATVSPEKLFYNKQFPSHKAAFTLTPGSYTQIGVSYDGTPLVKDTDYTIVGVTCDISPYLDKQDAGKDYKFTFNMSAGVYPTATVSLTDAAPSLAVALTPDDIHLTGERITLTATPENMPGAEFTWYVNGTNSYDNATQIPGATSTVYAFTPTVAETKYYFCKANGVVNSNIVEAKVVEPVSPVFTADPEDKTVVAGLSAAFKAEASGVPTPTYQWQMSVNGGTVWSNVMDGTGGDTNVYTTAPTTEAMNRRLYRCIATNKAGTAMSKYATLTVEAQKYDISANPASLDFGAKTVGYSTIPAAQTVTVMNDGNWNVTLKDIVANSFFDIVPDADWTTALAPGESHTFTVCPKKNLTVNSYSETLNVTTDKGTSAATTANFVVNQLLDVNIVGDTSIVKGQSTTLTVHAQYGTGSYAYRWSGGGISDTTASVTVSPTVTTEYTVDVTDEGEGSATASHTVTVTYFNASATPTSASYDKYAATAGLAFTLDCGSYGFEALKNGADALVLGTDYEVKGGVYTVAQSYLNRQSTGTLTLTFDMDGGSDPEVKISVSDSSPINAYVTPTSAVYDKHTAVSGLDFTLINGSYAFVGITNGGAALVQGADYAVSGNAYRISQDYLNAQPVGALTLVFAMSGGVSPTAVITVSDTKPIDASVTPSFASYDRHTAVAGLDFTLEPGSYAFIGISADGTPLVQGADYTVNGGVYTVSRSFLNARPIGTLTLVFEMDGGADPASAIDIFDSSIGSASVTPSKATFYQYRAKSGIKFTLDPGKFALLDIRNGERTLIRGTDYKVDGNVYTVKKSYLNSLPAGNITLTFDMDGGNDPFATLAVLYGNGLLLDEVTLGKGKNVLAGNLLLSKTQKKVKWQSDDESVLQIIGKGVKAKLKPVAVGTARLTATFSDGVGVTVPVTVVEKEFAATGLKTKSSFSMRAGEKKEADATVNPSTASDKSIKWLTSDAQVATVDENGVITAVGKGECKIIAITTAAARKAITVSVKK